MPEIKKANAGTSAGNNNSRKDRIIPAQTALEILNTKIDQSRILSKSELRQLLNGYFTVNYPKFSYFKAPVTNTTPTKEIDLLQLHQAITGRYYKKATELFRAMEPGEAKAAFKRTSFDHCTIAGTFTARKTDGLKILSGYAVFDFDHLQEPEKLKGLLITDPFLDVQMIFTSPSGDGLKMILFNEDAAPYSVFYGVVINYLKNKYPTFAANLDGKTKDIARTCFLCHDATAFIKPQYLVLWQASKN
jgi:hypothetical protein